MRTDIRLISLLDPEAFALALHNTIIELENTGVEITDIKFSTAAASDSNSSGRSDGWCQYSALIVFTYYRQQKDKRRPSDMDQFKPDPELEVTITP